MNRDIRLFFIIQKLLEKHYTALELQNIIIKSFDFFPQPKEIYKDIDRIKKLGFNISETPRKRNLGTRFKIEKTPFNYSLKENEKELIKDIFKTYKNNDYVLTGLFNNIGSLLNFNLEEIIEDKFVKPESKLYLEIKKTIKKACSERKKISFLYNAIGKEARISTGFPCNFETDDKKVERFCLYMSDYPEEYRYIDYNLERIQEVPIISNEVMFGEFVDIFARFKIYPPTSFSYHLSKYDKIESRDEENNTITIRSKYYTSFRLVQKLFKYSDTVEIIEPDSARIMMMEKILKMQKLYF